MTIRPVLRMGDARLLGQARPVTEFGTPELAALVQDLWDTMEATEGVGLAAPQIGVDLQVVVFGFGANARYPDAAPVPRTVLINPVLSPLSSDQEGGWEGCLSLPGLRGWVPRYTRLRYEGQDENGAPLGRVAEGFHARVVQHECDHLIGKLYPMRMTDFTRFGFTDMLFPKASEDRDGPPQE